MRLRDISPLLWATLITSDLYLKSFKINVMHVTLPESQYIWIAELRSLKHLMKIFNYVTFLSFKFTTLVFSRFKWYDYDYIPHKQKGKIFIIMYP